MPEDSDAEIVMSEMSTLSHSERRVLDEALRGLTVKEIAERLTVTQATVKTHLGHIYGKLGVRGRLELLARVRQNVPPKVPGSSSTSSPEWPAGPPWFHRPWMPAVTVIAVSAFVLLIGMLVAITGGPRSTSLAAVVRLVEAGAVSDLRLDGDVLTAIEPSGQQYRVSGVSRDDISGLAAERGVPLGISPPAPTDRSLLYVFNLAGYLLVVGLIWLWFISSRRRRSARA